MLSTLLFVSFFFASAFGQQVCPNNGVFSQVTRSCFVVGEDKDFYQAEMSCIQMGGNLVTIRNFADNEAVRNFALDHVCCSVWIGHDNSGTWQDGNNITFTNFAAGEQTTPFRCVQLDPSQNGQWRTANCSAKSDFVCSVPPQVSRCEPGWTFFSKTGFCYRNYQDVPNVDWNTAVQRCRVRNAVLTTILNQDENHFVTVLAASGLSRNEREDMTWIGMKAVGNTTDRWVDGTLAAFKNFAPNEPNGRDECIQIYSNYNYRNRNEFGQWNDHPCNTRMNSYVCKKAVS